MTAIPVIVERTFNAPIEKVWDAITNNNAMKKWYFSLKEFKPVVGFEFEFEGGPPDKPPYVHKCKIIEVIPMKKLVHTWRYEGWKGETVVTWELTPEGAKTRLRLTHSGLDSFAINNNPDLDAHNFEAGWNSIIGTSLHNFLEPEMIGRTLEATRTLNAPRDLVWKVFTEPEHIMQWWGPNGFSLTIHEMDVREGGQWRFIMHGPDIHGQQTDFDNHNRFDEIVKPERIVYSHVSYPKHQTTITLADLGDKTKLHFEMRFESTAELERAIKEFGAREGQKQTLDRLEAYLNTF